MAEEAVLKMQRDDGTFVDLGLIVGDIKMSVVPPETDPSWRKYLNSMIDGGSISFNFSLEPEARPDLPHCRKCRRPIRSMGRHVRRHHPELVEITSNLRRLRLLYANGRFRRATQLAYALTEAGY